MKINFLHLSDIHISRQNSNHVSKILSALLNDLSHLQKEYFVSPNTVLITGDLIASGERATEEYKLAQDLFITPLLSKLGLKTNDLIYCPGNHEVDRTKIAAVTESGVASKIQDENSYTNFYESSEAQKLIFPHMQKKLEAYQAFIKTLSNPFLVNSNLFVDTYKITIGKYTIGVLSLNSAWLCCTEGSRSDKEKLVIGNNVFENAIEKVKDCNFKVALAHHGFEYLREWNQKKLRDLMARNISIFFTGHVHDSDFYHLRPILGNLYVSTGAALYPERTRHGYSIVSLDLDAKTLTIYLRKWYEERGVFDQETDKCAKGILLLENFTSDSASTNKLLDINKIKDSLRRSEKKDIILNPIEEIKDLQLQEIFVEPIISDKSNFDKENGYKKKYFTLQFLLESDENILFLGGKESGKTILLNSIRDEVLRNDTKFESQIPILISFSQIGKKNPDSIVKLIKQMLKETCTDSQVEEYLENGNFIILVDDYDDYRDDDREKKKKTLRLFNSNYKKCRCIISITESLSQTFQKETLSLNELLKAKNYYLAPLDTSKIREILKKWQAYHDFDIEHMLQQILYYFKQLEIPITPMAVTLFIGVLFKDVTAKKNIRNEAYLIENYLQSQLEKLSTRSNKGGLDFKEKESFLAHVAMDMVRTSKTDYSQAEFEEVKRKYFHGLKEDVPASELFDDFFSKSILSLSNGRISFHFKFWFNFFLAKAMENDDKKKREILKLPDYLKYATALGYKAGLSRNDESLLKVIDERIKNATKKYVKKYIDKKINATEFDTVLVNISENIEQEIKDKNTASNKDSVADEMYLSASDSKNSEEDIVALVTLGADIIRNTREIDGKKKVTYYRNNVNNFVCLMWLVIDSFKDFIGQKNREETLKILNLTQKDVENNDTKKLVKHVHQLIYRIVPLSVIIYMCEHLTNPKLKNTIIELLDETEDITREVFYSLLLFQADFSEGIKRLEKLVEKSSSHIINYLIFMFVKFYCHEHLVSEENMQKIFSLIRTIRKKGAQLPKGKDTTPYFRDNFETEVMKELQAAKTKLELNLVS